MFICKSSPKWVYSWSSKQSHPTNPHGIAVIEVPGSSLSPGSKDPRAACIHWTTWASTKMLKGTPRKGNFLDQHVEAQKNQRWMVQMIFLFILGGCSCSSPRKVGSWYLEKRYIMPDFRQNLFLESLGDYLANGLWVVQDVCFVLGLGFVLPKWVIFLVPSWDMWSFPRGLGEWKLPLQFAAFSRRKRWRIIRAITMGLGGEGAVVGLGLEGGNLSTRASWIPRPELNVALGEEWGAP